MSRSLLTCWWQCQWGPDPRGPRRAKVQERESRVFDGNWGFGHDTEEKTLSMPPYLQRLGREQRTRRSQPPRRQGQGSGGGDVSGLNRSRNAHGTGQHTTDLQGLYRGMAGYFSKNQGGEQTAGAWGEGIQTSALWGDGHSTLCSELTHHR